MSNQVTVQYGIEKSTLEPVIVLELDGARFAAFSVAQARTFTADIVQACARAEADAMMIRFTKEMNFPPGSLDVIMHMFRNFRAQLDSELVERSITPPTLTDKPQ